MEIPQIPEATLVIPEYYAVPKANGRYKLIFPLTSSGNLKKIKGVKPIRIISRPVRHAVLLETHSDPIALNLFSKADREKIHAYFEHIEEHKDEAIDTLQEKFIPKKRKPRAKPVPKGPISHQPVDEVPGPPKPVSDAISLELDEPSTTPKMKSLIHRVNRPQPQPDIIPPPSSPVVSEPAKKKAGRPRVHISDEDKDIIHRHYTLLEHPKKQGQKAIKNAEMTKLAKDFNNVRKRVGPQEYLRSPEYETFKHTHGAGLIGSVVDFAKTLYQGRSDYPHDQKKLIEQFGSMTVRHIRIGRTPLPSLITGALNVVTLGAFSKMMKKSPYDKLYHLFIILTLDNGKTMLVEKNEAIHLALNPPAMPRNTSWLDVNTIPSTLTFHLLMENTKKAMGNLFFPYDPTKNNCQDFIIAIFKSNNMLTQDVMAFVKQDVASLFKNFENTKALMNAVTTLGSKVDILKKGGRLNQKPVLEEYSKLTNHLVGHITDPEEPLDKKDAKQSIDLIDRIARIKGTGVIQSVIFKKPKWTVDTAIDWLDSHKYIHPKVDEEPNTLRFRQSEPIEGTKYRTKTLGKSGILFNIGYDKLKSPSKSIRMPPKKIYMSGMSGMGLEGNAGIGSGIGAGIGAGMEYESDSEEYESGSDDEGAGLYAGGRGMGAGIGAGIQHLHVHVHHPEGGKVNWKKVGNTVWKVAKPIVKEVSHKYLPQLGEDAGIALGTAAATLSGNPEMAPMAASIGSKLGKAAGKAADKKVQGLGIGAGVRKGRFEKGSKEAMEWCAKMKAAREAKR
jgi:hypothetical protein